jgi:hypothetical protein
MLRLRLLLDYHRLNRTRAATDALRQLGRRRLSAILANTKSAGQIRICAFTLQSYLFSFRERVKELYH